MLHLKQLYELFLCLFSFLVFHIFDISSRQTLQMIFQPLNLIYSRLSCNQPLNKPFDQAARISELRFQRAVFLFCFHITCTDSFLYLFVLFVLFTLDLMSRLPPSLALSLAWMPVCHPCGSFGRRLFWSWPSLPLRAERELLTSELIDGAVGSSLTASGFFTVHRYSLCLTSLRLFSFFIQFPLDTFMSTCLQIFLFFPFSPSAFTGWM